MIIVAICLLGNGIVYWNQNGRESMRVCVDDLLSRKGDRIPSSDLGFGSAVGSKCATSTSEVGSRFSPPLLRLDIHFSRRFLNNSCHPHVPV